MADQVEFTIQESDASRPGWASLQQLIAEEGQVEWVEAAFDWHISSHVLAALVEGRPVGFLRFVVQTIGLEDDHEPVSLDSKLLTEAKILAFGVKEAYRRKGIGRALQQRAIERARELGCYQVRSFSGGEHIENHRLKLALGFAVYAFVRDGDTRCAYYLLPLRVGTEQK